MWLFSTGQSYVREQEGLLQALLSSIVTCTEVMLRYSSAQTWIQLPVPLLLFQSTTDEQKPIAGLKGSILHKIQAELLGPLNENIGALFVNICFATS
jgi:hypothetical protein